MAHPGALPAINKEAVHKVLLVGKSLGATLADYTEFDRKNYFYPDIPKGYQISQYAYPLVSGGSLNGVAITRIHLEEDTARSQHQGDTSLVDYNRAGVPLLELVTEPVIHSAEEAGSFARELQTLLRTLGAGEANMEKGELRIEANISVAPVATTTEHKSDTLGTKVEVKNLNSFRSVERAIAYEITRQTTLLESGGTVVQETRGWDEVAQKTYTQRKKERAHDYRYFPDPDLPKLIISEVPEWSAEALNKGIPELPWERRSRLMSLGIKKEYVEMFVQNNRFANLFDAIEGDKELAANYLGSDLAGLVAQHGEPGLAHITAQGLSAMLSAINEGKLSSRGAKDALADVFMRGGNLAEVIQTYQQESGEEALTSIAQKVIDANPGVAAEYKAGKGAALQFLIGCGMKESGGSANPEVLKKIIERLIM